jgi:hypothetical protein
MTPEHEHRILAWLHGLSMLRTFKQPNAKQMMLLTQTEAKQCCIGSPPIKAYVMRAAVH